MDSNLTDEQVGHFIVQYFDTFRVSGGIWICGVIKENVISYNKLTIDTIPIRFSQEMDAVLGILLEWFYARYHVYHYDRAIADGMPPSPTTSRNSESLMKPRVELGIDLEELGVQEEVVDPPRSQVPLAQPIYNLSPKDEANAKKTKDHTSMINVLRKALNNKWPKDDRVDDRVAGLNLKKSENHDALRVERQATHFSYSGEPRAGDEERPVVAATLYGP